MKLSEDPNDVLKWALDQEPRYDVKKIWKLADGSPHLIEYEMILDKEIL